MSFITIMCAKAAKITSITKNIKMIRKLFWYTLAAFILFLFSYVSSKKLGRDIKEFLVPDGQAAAGGHRQLRGFHGPQHMQRIEFDMPIDVEVEMGDMFETLRHDSMMDMPPEIREMMEQDWEQMNQMRIEQHIQMQPRQPKHQEPK